jgi:hypothetical protein
MSSINSINDLSDLIFNIKEKITDYDFISLMSKLNSIKKERDEESLNNKIDMYKITIYYPFISMENDVCECHPYKFTGQKHAINIKKLSFITELVSCKNNKNNCVDNYCCNCSSNMNNCIRIQTLLNAAKSNHNCYKNIDLCTLVKVVDEKCKELLSELNYSINRSGLVESVEIIDEENDDEEEEDEIRRKKIIRHKINFDIEIFLDSIEKMN